MSVDFPVQPFYAQWQCTAHLGIVAELCQRGLSEVFGQRVAGPAVDAKREVDGDFALRLGGMQPATRQVEGITGLQHSVDVSLVLRGLGDGGATVGPGLITQGSAWTGSWMIQRLVPSICRTKTSWTS